jgi:hypothetical protein
MARTTTSSSYVGEVLSPKKNTCVAQKHIKHDKIRTLSILNAPQFAKR